MKKKPYINYLLPILLLFTIPQLTKANGYTLQGTILDSLDNKPIEFAAIKLLSAKDSSIIHGTLCDDVGRFEFKNIKSSPFILEISFIGYNSAFVDVPASKFTQSIVNIKAIKLSSSSIMLSGIEIIAELPELIVKEDTLEYNAAAFKMQQSAMVEDLIKRLPGVSVDNDGKISTPTGKQVTRVFVDGKEFFGKDPKMATKNLTANIVDKIQVVEKKSDLAILTGVEDDDPEIVINITIKKGMKKGWMGNITSGLGSLIENENEVRYNENILVSRFDDKNQLSFVANANNINQQGSTDDSNNIRSGRSRFSNGNGIISSNSFGLNTANIIGSKIKFGGNVTYNYSDNFGDSKSSKQNLDVNKPSFQRGESTDQDYSNNLSFNGKLEYRPDSATTIVFTPTLSYNWSTSAGNSHQNTRINPTDSIMINDIESANTLKSNGMNLKTQLDVSRKLSQAGRRISFSTWFSSNISNGDGTNNSTEIYYNALTKNRILNQQSHSSGDRSVVNARLTYVEPIGKGNFINFSYNAQVNNTINERQTYDYDSINNEYILLNKDFSKNSETKTISHTLKANFNSRKKKYAYNIGLSVIPSHTSSKSYIKDWHGAGQDSVTNSPNPRNVVNLSPQLDFTYRFRNDKTIKRNMRLKYNGKTYQPSVSQLDPTPNNNNPLNIRIGNPNLLPSFRNTISLDYNDYNRQSQRSFTTSLIHIFSQNEFVNYTTYNDSTQVRQTSPVNENGSWNNAMNVLYTKPLDGKKRFKFSTQSDISYKNQVGYSTLDSKSESVKNISKTTNLGETLGLSYSNDWFYGQLKSSFKYSDTRYSLESIKNQSYYSFNLTYNTQIDLPQSWVLSSDINYSGYRGLSAGYDKNELIWNIEINKHIFKNKKGVLRLQVNDILQQKLNINRNITATYTTDTEYKVLTSYAMLSFAYQFNNVGAKEKGNR